MKWSCFNRWLMSLMIPSRTNESNIMYMFDMLKI